MAEIAFGTTVHLRLGMALQESGAGGPLFDKLQIYRPEKVIVSLFLHGFTRSNAAGEVDVVL